MAILPFWAMSFMVLRGFVYAVAVNFYAFRLTFSLILHRILHHFTLHLAPKRSAFSGKLHLILLKTAQKLEQIAVLCNVYSFHLHL